MEQQKRLLLASVLSLGVIMVWYTLFPPPEPQRPEVVEKQLEVSDSGKNQKTNVNSSKAPSNIGSSNANAEKKDSDSNLEQAAVNAEPKKVEIAALDIRLENDQFISSISNYGPSSSWVELKEYFEPFNIAGPENKKSKLIKGAEGFSDFFQFDKSSKQERINLTKSNNEIIATSTKTYGDVETRIKLSKNAYSLSYEHTLTPKANQKIVPVLDFSFKPQSWALNPETEKDDTYSSFQVVFLLNNEFETIDLKEMISDGESEKVYGGDLAWVGIAERYFMRAAIFDKPQRARVIVKRYADHNFKVEVHFAERPINTGKAEKINYEIFSGPKAKSVLESYKVQLEKTIDLGILTPICLILIGLMSFFYSVISNWGIAIILLTIFIKTILYPLTKKSYVGMAAMGALKPKLDKLKEKYGDDRQKLQEATLNLYKTEGINPFGGCFPMLLQLPIFFALYQTLYTDVSLYQAPFIDFWINDLSAQDPLYILPVLLGIATFMQQKLSPQTSMDETQAKMMLYMMPGMMMIFMLFLPSGLNLYILANTVITVIQQKIIQSKTKPRKA